MDKNSTILLTGAAGFIGSYLLGDLNKKGYSTIIIADDFSEEDKWFNFDSKQYVTKINREVLFEWLTMTKPDINFVFHLGARTDTAEFDYSIHQKLNVDYSKKIWNYCSANKVPLVYASSAATYGSGELGYKDDHDIVEKLQPLNPYGISKNEFDKWAIRESRVSAERSLETAPPFWCGLKFFNVYGPNEYHKDRMASMVFHGFNQIQKTGKVKLFRSHKPEFEDGEQLRDFIYVEDVARVCCGLMENPIQSGLYNLGTGKARSFKDLANAIFATINKKPEIDFIDMPADIRDRYQYFTEANMDKLRNAGYQQGFFSLEEGISDYVKRYLLKKDYY